MKLPVDKNAEALYLDDSTIAESEEVSPGVVIETACDCRTNTEQLPFGLRAAEPASADPPP